ncbi:hypothetical protein REC12_24365 [Desulfosporosinus sp. PR]|uniref:HTH domain-containing protein n=1 Tax=Candidatus Desulfosporosinus nitrosoreducens TaxID=3401928 RepID=UPI0027FDA753|nr:HTH domain-containing protein [Desulfosporosinus sp. PR]MDQ7096731.1 hypothetical protein [Desulfosporosinus sp. PR]
MQEHKIKISNMLTKDKLKEKFLTIVNEYKISLKTLNIVTQVSIESLSDFVNGKKEITDLFLIENRGLFNLIIFLSDGMPASVVSEDKRVKAVIELLVLLFGLEYETIALYAGLNKQDIASFMQDTASIDYEKKYKLAAASLMLHYLFKNPSNPSLLGR